MRIRQFTAPSTADALRELRATLGEEALVLSTHSEPGGVVITAAVDHEPGGDPVPMQGGRAMTTDDLGRTGVQFDLALIRTQLEQLGRRVQRMDRALFDLGADAGALGPHGREVVERLLSSGLGPHVAQPVALGFERAVAQARPHEPARARHGGAARLGTDRGAGRPDWQRQDDDHRQARGARTARG